MNDPKNQNQINIELSDEMAEVPIPILQLLPTPGPNLLSTYNHCPDAES